MTFEDFQETIITRCHEANACKSEFRRLMKAVDKNDKSEFIRVLLDNHWWCIYNKIYDSAFFLELEDQDILLEAGLPTQLNSPIEFKVETIGDKQWKPFNEGANADNGIGDYMTFDEANDPKIGRLLPTEEDFENLYQLSSVWALYQGQFGRLFDGRLFIPAGGLLPSYSNVCEVGNYGYSWSSTVSGTNAFLFEFNTTYLDTSYTYHHSYSLQVRCLVK